MEQYNVTGMSCAACSARVEKAVSAVPGVTACSGCLQPRNRYGAIIRFHSLPLKGQSIKFFKKTYCRLLLFHCVKGRLCTCLPGRGFRFRSGPVNQDVAQISCQYEKKCAKNSQTLQSLKQYICIFVLIFLLFLNFMFSHKITVYPILVFLTFILCQNTSFYTLL